MKEEKRKESVEEKESVPVVESGVATESPRVDEGVSVEEKPVVVASVGGASVEEEKGVSVEEETVSVEEKVVEETLPVEVPKVELKETPERTEKEAETLEATVMEVEEKPEVAVIEEPVNPTPEVELKATPAIELKETPTTELKETPALEERQSPEVEVIAQPTEAPQVEVTATESPAPELKRTPSIELNFSPSPQLNPAASPLPVTQTTQTTQPEHTEQATQTDLPLTQMLEMEKRLMQNEETKLLASLLPDDDDTDESWSDEQSKEATKTSKPKEVYKPMILGVYVDEKESAPTPPRASKKRIVVENESPFCSPSKQVSVAAAQVTPVRPSRVEKKTQEASPTKVVNECFVVGNYLPETPAESSFLQLLAEKSVSYPVAVRRLLKEQEGERQRFQVLMQRQTSLFQQTYFAERAKWNAVSIPALH